MNTKDRQYGFHNGSFQVEGCSVADLAKTYQTPLYVYSTSLLLDRARRLKKAMQGIDHSIFFAMKANPAQQVLKLLQGEGIGVDLVSAGEMARAERAGVPPGMMVFSGVGKTIEELETAIDRKIHSINVESVSEFATLEKIAIRKNAQPLVALRFNPDVNPKTHPYISTGLRENKFGLTKREIIALLKSHPNTACRVEGLSLHIGSQIKTLKPFHDAILKAIELADEIEKKKLGRITFLDLGGGLAISYDGKKVPSIEDYGKLLQKHFGKKSKNHGRFQIGLEPGRSLVAECGTLVTRVLYRKDREGKHFLILDAGMNDFMRPALYQSYHTIHSAQKRTGKTEKIDLVGPVCESSDCFAKNRVMPQGIEEGELIVIRDVGAYGMSMANGYNGRPLPPEIWVDDKKVVVGRRRGKVADFWRDET